MKLKQTILISNISQAIKKLIFWASYAGLFNQKQPTEINVFHNYVQSLCVPFSPVLGLYIKRGRETMSLALQVRYRSLETTETLVVSSLLSVGGTFLSNRVDKFGDDVSARSPAHVRFDVTCCPSRRFCSFRPHLEFISCS